MVLPSKTIEENLESMLAPPGTGMEKYGFEDKKGEGNIADVDDLPHFTAQVPPVSGVIFLPSTWSKTAQETISRQLYK